VLLEELKEARRRRKVVPKKEGERKVKEPTVKQETRAEPPKTRKRKEDEGKAEAPPLEEKKQKIESPSTLTPLLAPVKLQSPSTLTPLLGPVNLDSAPNAAVQRYRRSMASLPTEILSPPSSPVRD